MKIVNEVTMTGRLTAEDELFLAKILYPGPLHVFAPCGIANPKYTLFATQVIAAEEVYAPKPGYWLWGEQFFQFLIRTQSNDAVRSLFPRAGDFQPLTGRVSRRIPIHHEKILEQPEWPCLDARSLADLCRLLRKKEVMLYGYDPKQNYKRHFSTMSIEGAKLMLTITPNSQVQGELAKSDFPYQPGILARDDTQTFLGEVAEQCPQPSRVGKNARPKSRKSWIERLFG